MSTKKILNKDVSNVVEESLTGYLMAYKKYYKKIGEYNAFQYRGHRKDKVALVIGGGSGHEPLFTGYCGAGLADAVACGNICASPNPELIMMAAKAVDQGKGVLFVYGNYAGDNLNFDMAEEMCRAEGMKTAHVREWDDFASAPKERITDRRGIAGDVYTIKIAGAACDAGLDLDEVVRITEKARDNTNTIGLATSPGTLPGNDKPTFEIADDEMEFGMGLHGEPGIERTKMMPCCDMVERMYNELMAEMGLKSGDEIAVLVNGLGSTPLLELNLVYYELYKRMHRDGLKVYDAEVKTYCTCMEMGGFSITFLKLDDELKKYYDAPCYSPYYAKGSFSGVVEDASSDADEEEPEFDETDVEPAVITRSKDGVLEELNAEDTRNMLLYIADKIIANKPYLTEVDSAIGDGDHGIGMAGGMQKAKKKLLKMQGEENAYHLFETAGQAMLMSMGGASGVIFGSLYLAGAKGMDPKGTITAEDLARMEKKSLDAIQERGGAQVGDKTMVDALAPAVDALEANSGKGLLEMLKAAEEAARCGMEDTKKYVAKFGRAKSLLERAIGHQDAGATSVYLIFQGMREFVEGAID
ncbi:dihydroxyacetone kinase subunit L [Faecalicatena contorta]|uniref:Dihydroxyacetone kinase subunit L n=1 Tax=Faecalicatena fissicatena TaxID=290055 RepID=A0ABS2E9K3_9FIRM|nr:MULTISPECIES: dihydroxyacetone kinase subunit DhaL [Faecalicatena]MBM6685371.1 dihydroxyacetone kinase subunit L [Faecalicatena contorta]MBM6711130.1 dihydroxyacetone kinase subunit L [Faecalicatena contorta]MBM6738318.1 dihydroxyacetone kinase subunit L [Faecalicatena fissicatena]